MSIERGIVTENNGDMILVESDADMLCTACSIKSSCSICNDAGKKYLWMNNTIGAEKGEGVTFVIEEKSVVAASALLYFVPVLLLIAGVVLGYVLAPGLGFDRDVSAEIGGIIGLLAFIIILALVSRVIKKHSIFYPVLLDSTAPDSQNLS